MKKLYFSAFLLCTTLGRLYAQEILWEKNIASSSQDFLSQVSTTIDGQYLISGSSIQTKSEITSNSKNQNSGYDFHIVKLNTDGKEIFNKYFSGNGHDHLISTVVTKEGGSLLAGTSYSTKGLDKTNESKGGADFWLVRLSENGDIIWQQTLGTSADEEARVVIQTTDEGFIAGGNIQNNPKGYGGKDLIFYRLDKEGKELSHLILGGRGNDELEKMIPTKDGGVLIGAYSRSPISGTKKTANIGESDYWLVKLDRNLKIEWEKNYGSSGEDHLRSLALTSTGYLVGGETMAKEGTDIELFSLNERGEELWHKIYSIGGRDILKGMNVIHSADDKSTSGILLGGYTQSEGRSEENDESFWMLYVDLKGNEQWRKHVRGESREREERLSDLILNRDGSYILAGTSSPKLGSENWKIIKLGDKQVSDLLPKYDIKIYPNPVSDYTYIEIGFDFKEADILLYDMSGRQLQSVKTKNKVTKINTQTLVQGAYLVTIKTDTDKTANAKLIKK